MNYLASLKKVYLQLPSSAKQVVSVIPPSWILGKTYRNQRKFLQESSKWSGTELFDFQQRTLFDLVEFAATTVPYYRDLFKKLGLPSRLRSIEEFLRLPYLTKEDVIKEQTRMLSEAIPAKCRFEVTTGGTSGTPLRFWMSSEAYAKEWAFVHDLIERFDIVPTDRKLGLRGVPFPNASQGVYLQHNPVYRELQLSPFHLTADVISSVKKDILSFQPKYIHGYPSAISEFARVASDGGWGRSLKLKGVLAISESLFPFQSELIRNAFDCEVFSFYGQTERLIFAGNAPEISGYAIDPRYGFTEDINGDLVGTGFLNRAMPMIRYKTGDKVKLGSSFDMGKRGIGSFSRISEIEGRWQQEMVVGKNNALVSVTALNMHSDLFKNVQRFQYHQKLPGKLSLLLLPKSGFDINVDSIIIRNAFKDKVGNEIDLEIVMATHIPLTVRGKHKFLIQELDLSHRS